MEELSNLNVRSIIVTSGTLSPLPSYSMELGIPFPHTLENPHIIEGNQVHVRVIGKGVSGKLLSSSYDRRQDGEYYSELGSTLASLSKVIPAGMLIFFPSYGVMETCVERWGGPSLSRPNKPVGRNAFFAQRKKTNTSKQYAFPRIAPAFNTSAFGNSGSSPWKRMLAAKAIVLEPRASAELPEAIEEFKRFLEMPKSSGCILMGVCRGKISEGIDFAHDMSRAVIITGIPFAPAFDAKVKMKREFLDCAKAVASSKPNGDAGFSNFNDAQREDNSFASKLSGGEWYLQQAHRAVNQAVGRVIRNKSDYGAILLLDSRFDQPRNREGLSRWVRPHVLSDEGFGIAVKALGSFYREASAQAKIRAESKPAPIEVDFDDSQLSDDDSVGNVKNIAIITNQNAVNGNVSGDIEEAYVAPGRVVAKVSVEAYSCTTGKEIIPKVVRKANATQNFDGVFKRSATATAPRPQRKTAASIFMEKTKLLMSTNDQSTIRKLIVIMKKQGDSKDVKGFRQSASGIIDLILKAEKHESPPIANDERMLFLFLELVPPAYRNEFELIALHNIVETSSFGQQCKENLLLNELSRVFSATVRTLHLAWFSRVTQESSFVQHAQVVISFVCKTERVAGQTMLRSFLRMIPKERHEICKRLFEDIDGTRRMEQRKQQQRTKVGESSIDVNRFLPATVVNKRSFGRFDNSSSKELTSTEASATKVAAPPSAPTKSSSRSLPAGERKVPVNPYKRIKTKSAVSTVPAKSKSIPVLTGTTKASSLSSILESIESDPHVYHKKPSASAAIKSNAPSGLTCPLCSTHMTKPFIAPCGHLACLGCWKGWLKRSETCATCRAPTKLDAISLAVFEKASTGTSTSKTTDKAKNEATLPKADNSDGELELY